MKIYPSKHRFATVAEIDPNEDIALGYLDSEFLEENININVSDEYTISSKKELLPYADLKTLNLTLYNEDGKPLDKEEQEKMLIRQLSGNYTYFPKASTIFEPHNFSYKVLAKKNMKYLTARKYNIKVACANEDLAKQLIQLFADSYERNLCPLNIKFNGGDKKLESLFDVSMQDADFLFISSLDGVHYDSSEDAIDIEELFQYNVVPFIFCDRLPGEDAIKYEDQQEKTFSTSENVSAYPPDYTTKYYFKQPKIEKNVVYHSIFKYHSETPIVIKEYVNKGFAIYCNSDMLTKLGELSSLFYNTLMYVYLKTYISTQTITEWIADTMPDYIVQNGRLTQKEKFTSNMELHKLLGLREGDVTPIEVNIDSEYVYYTGMSSSYLVFKKITTEENADPIKNTDAMAIFTERKNIMFYDKFIYKITEDITDKISCSSSGDTLTVYVKPFKNTDLNTGNFLTTQSLEIKLTPGAMQQTVYLHWNIATSSLALSDELKNDNILLANIQVIKEKKDSKLYDMRVRGGGLPESAKDIYDCLDIGNILGRPYRKGGALISTVNLPKHLEARRDEIENIIKSTLRQHMIADDYLILNLEFN